MHVGMEWFKLGLHVTKDRYCLRVQKYKDVSIFLLADSIVNIDVSFDQVSDADETVRKQTLSTVLT